MTTSADRPPAISSAGGRAPHSADYLRGYNTGYRTAAYRATKAKIGRPMRWNAELGEFEVQCLDCRAHCRSSYWPMTLEFWKPGNVQRCRACIAEHGRAKQRVRRQDPAIRARDNANAAAWRDRNPGYNVETARIWREQNPERKRETDRARYMARKAAA